LRRSALSIDRYIVDFETVISSHSFVSSYSLTIDRKTRDIAFLPGTIEFRNGTVLDFKEFSESKGTAVEKYVYGYNHRRGSTTIFRYDNSPDPRARQLMTFPHHKHVEPDKLVESNILIDLSAVLDEIEGIQTESEE
jgi:hypothetical protein